MASRRLCANDYNMGWYNRDVLPDLRLNDRVRLRKPHPCGGYEWKVVRLGADIGLEWYGGNAFGRQRGKPKLGKARVLCALRAPSCQLFF